MEFGIEPHSLFQARGTTGNDHISAILPNARHRRAVFSVLVLLQYWDPVLLSIVATAVFEYYY